MVASSCSTKPVHEPHDDDAFVCARTSSNVNSFFVEIARTMSPLQTPLQPQISALSGRFATLPALYITGVSRTSRYLLLRVKVKGDHREVEAISTWAIGGTPEHLAAAIQRDLPFYRTAVEAAGLKRQ